MFLFIFADDTFVVKFLIPNFLTDMKMKKWFLVAAMAAFFVTPAGAQDSLEVNMAADVVNQYVWRGQYCGAVSLQPSLGLGYKGLSLEAWGSVGLSEPSDDKELDLTLSYTLGGLTVGVTDYWFNSPSERYFLYDAHRTSHVFEAFAGYDFGFLSLTWYTNFAGNDGENNDGERAYSSFVQATAPFRLASCDWEATIGVAPYATTSYDTDGFAVTELSLKATKEISVTDKFSIPLFAAISANPRDQKAYFLFGFTLKP